MLCFLLPVSRPAPCVHQEEGWGAEGRVSLVPQISYWIYRTAPVRSRVCFCASGGTKGGPAAARQPGACPRTTPIPLQPLSSFTLESRGGSCQAVRPPADIFTAVPQTSSRPRSTMSRQQQQQQQRTSFRLSDNLVEVKSKVSDGLLTDAVSDAGCALSGPQPSALLIQIVM